MSNVSSQEPASGSGSPVALENSTPASPDAGTAPTDSVVPRIQQAISGASAKAVAEHFGPDGSPAKRGQGKRGPDKQPRKIRARVPVGKVADSPGQTPLALPDPAPLPVTDWQPDPVADTAATERAVAAIVGQLDRLTSTSIWLLAKRWFGDEAIADSARKNVAMDDAEKDGLIVGGAYVWQKYLGQMEDPRELAFWACAIGYLAKVGVSVAQLNVDRKKIAQP